jgi:hypothetical protein
VWHLRLYSIRHKILAFFAVLILGIPLLGGLDIALSHRMHTSISTVRNETHDAIRIAELRAIFLDFLVLLDKDLFLDEKEVACARLHQNFLGKLDAYIQAEQAKQTSASREEVVILSQSRYFISDTRQWALYDGTMDSSFWYTPHKQLFKCQTVIGKAFKHCW